MVINVNTMILIPSYKPTLKLIKTVESIQNKTNTPIMIVDDGSGKEYYEYFKICEIKGCILIHHKVNKGKGAALKTGFKEIKDKFKTVKNVVTVDADGQHQVDDILKLIKKADTFNGLILGTRDFNQANVPLKSRIGNKFSSVYFKLTTNKSLKDTQTGLRLIPSSLFNIALNTEGDRYEYEMNFLMNIANNDLPFTTVDIQTIYEDNNSGSHFNVFKDSFLIYRAFFTFIIVAVVSFLVDISWFYLTISLIGYSVYSIFIATIIARLLSGLVNYALNAKFSFKANKPTPGNISKYLILFFSIMLTSSLLVYVLQSLPAPIVITKTIVDLGLFILSYYIQANWVFKKMEVSL